MSLIVFGGSAIHQCWNRLFLESAEELFIKIAVVGNRFDFHSQSYGLLNGYRTIGVLAHINCDDLCPARPQTERNCFLIVFEGPNAL